MCYSMPGSPVLLYLPESAQIHVYWVSDLLSNVSSSVIPFSLCLESFPASGFFQSVSSSYKVAKVLELQHQSFQRVFRVDLFDWFDLLSVKGTLRVFSITAIWRHQFFGAQSSLWSSSRTCTWLFEKPQLWLYRPLSAKWCLYILMHCLVWSYLSFQGASIF